MAVEAKCFSVKLGIYEILADCSVAVRQAADEAAGEMDGFPRNLIAALGRVNRQGEFFLRVTARRSFILPDNPAVFAVISELRREVGLSLGAIGAALHCENDFLGIDARDADTTTCGKWLKDSSELMTELAEKFRRAGEKLALILLSDVDSPPLRNGELAQKINS